MAGLAIASAILLAWIFPPMGIWPLAFVCMGPWCYGVVTSQRAWVIHWTSFLAGWLFYLAAVRWLMPVTGYGYVALAGYLALYWPAAAWAIRAGLRHSLSPIWTLPAAWVATEYLRAWVMSGFPWFFVGHALYDQTRFIQICDLTGAYGVSFLALLVTGVLVEWRVQRRRRRQQPARVLQLRFGAATTALLLMATLAYGEFQIGQTDWGVGPRVAVIQENHPLNSRPPYHGRVSVLKIFADYVSRAAEAIQEKPDLVVFPETAWGAVQNRQFLSVERNAVDGVPPGAWNYGAFCDQVIAALARGDFPAVNRLLGSLRWDEKDGPLQLLPNTSGQPTTVVVGTLAIEVSEREVYPSVNRYNSALLYNPDGQQRDERYDKVHLVPFGELVPFRRAKFIGINLHPLYSWLNSLSPFSDGGKEEYTLTPGDQLRVFELKSANGVHRFGIPICYEDVMPYIARGFVWGTGERRADFLVNISNDGWFREGELPQHLAICMFRAVENRVAIARAVNTGISAVIDPNGRVMTAVEVQGRRVGPDVSGYRCLSIPLDRRSSFYGKYGDWFAGLCLASGAALWVEAVVTRWILAFRRRLRSWRRAGAS